MVVIPEPTTRREGLTVVMDDEEMDTENSKLRRRVGLLLSWTHCLERGSVPVNFALRRAAQSSSSTQSDYCIRLALFCRSDHSVCVCARALPKCPLLLLLPRLGRSLSLSLSLCACGQRVHFPFCSIANSTRTTKHGWPMLERGARHSLSSCRVAVDTLAAQWFPDSDRWRQRSERIRVSLLAKHLFNAILARGWTHDQASNTTNRAGSVVSLRIHASASFLPASVG